MAKKITDETLKFNIVINGDDAKKEYGQLERANRKLLQSNEDMEAQAQKLAKANKQNSEEYKKLKADIDANSKAVAANEEKMKGLTQEIGINNLTMRQLSKEAGRLRGILANTDPNTEKWAEYSKQLTAVNNRQAELRGQMKDTKEAMSEQIGVLDKFGAGFMQVVDGLKSGNYKEAAAGFQMIGEGIKSATKASLAFIATPIGATLATLAGIGFIVKQWFDYNDAIKESVILTEQITKLQGEQADAIRLRNAAMKETFGTDEKENLEVARNLVEQFKISYEEAFDVIEDGYVKGQKNNNEYLDSLREYPAFFASMGYSAQQFKDIVTKGYDLGIYSDKLPDALKEFDISMKEQTKSTREALVNAFGAPFTDELLKRVKTGEITTKQALDSVASEAERLGLNIEQNARITADVFRGAGEDAGGAVVLFEAVASAAKDANRPLTELEQSTKDLADANLELEKAQDAALKSDNYISFTRDVQGFWTKIKTLFFEAVKFITDTVTTVTENSIAFISSIIITAQALPGMLKAGIKDIANNVFDLIKTFTGLGDVIGKLLKLDFSGAKESAAEFKKNFQKSFGEVKDSAKGTISAIIGIQQQAQKGVLDDFDKKRQGAVDVANEEEARKIRLENERLTFEEQEALRKEQEAKDKAAREKRLQEITTNEKAITEFLASEKQKRELDTKIGIERELAEIDIKYAKLLSKAGTNLDLINQLEDLKTQEKNDLKLQREKELAEKLQLLTEENYVNQEAARLEREALEAETQTEKDLLMLERETLLAQQKLDVELYLAEEKLRINNATEEEISAIKEKFSIQQEKLDYDTSRKRMQIAKNEADFKKKQVESQVSEVETATGQLAGLLGRQTAAGKAAAAAQATISTYQGVTRVWEAKSTLPEPLGTAAKIVSTIAVLASGLGAVSKINSTPTNIGYEEGLYPVTRAQDGKKYNARFGGHPTTQIVGAPTTFLAGEMPEMIIDPNTFKRMDPKVVDYVLQLAGKRPMGYESGKYQDTSTTASLPSSTSNNEFMVLAVETLNELRVELKNLKINFTLDDELSRQGHEEKLKATKQASKS